MITDVHNFDKWFILQSDIPITLEEQDEIIDLAKQVLRRKNDKRKVFVLEDIDFIAKEV